MTDQQSPSRTTVDRSEASTAELVRLAAEQISRLVRDELQLARNIQPSLLPKELPKLEGYGLAGHCETPSQVGGDFYDVLRISESKYLLFVTDVMGKGVPAAMFASILQRLVRVMPEWVSGPGEMLGRINSMLYEELSAVEMFVTAQLALIDMREKLLTVATAGQGPILVASTETTAPERLLPDALSSKMGLHPWALNA